MSLKRLPKINAQAPESVQWDPPAEALVKWDASIKAAESDNNTITMYDPIGSDGWTEGVTAKRVSAALRSIGSQEVIVSINSPGGDFFEGLAIYNLLREHPHKVTVKVVGLAASAASIIAMAGDDVQVARSGFLMIHNAWAFAVGNKQDFRDVADVLARFDESMAELYTQVTGLSKKKVVALMDDETWMTGQEAIDSGFATALLDVDAVFQDTSAKALGNAALRKVDTMLAKQGLPRSERRELLKEITGMPGAAHSTVKPGADSALVPDVLALISALKTTH